MLCNYFSGLACFFFQFTLYSKSFVLLVPGVDEEESVTTEAAESLVAPGEEAIAVPSLVVSSWLTVPVRQLPDACNKGKYVFMASKLF